MARILRGVIRWADGNPTRGHKHAGFPLTLELNDSALPKRSWVKISPIRTLSTERIGEKLGKADPEELTQIIEGLNELIGA